MTNERAAAVDLSVVLPAHNEVALLGSTVTNLASGLERRGLSYEILVVDNGSRDGTGRLARVLAAQLPTLRVLSLPRGDYGAALAAGIRAARGDAIATFDVDYYDLSFLDKALSRLAQDGAAIVVASKRAPGAADRRPVLRRLLTFGFTGLLRRVLGLKVSDAHGMKLLDAARVRELVTSTRLRHSVFDVELVLRAERAGVSVVELPATVTERRPPRSSVLRRSASTMLDVVRLRRLLGPPERQQRS